MSGHTITWAGKQQPVEWQIRTGGGASRNAVRHADPEDAARALMDDPMARMLCVIGGRVTIGNGEAVRPVYEAMARIRDKEADDAQ